MPNLLLGLPSGLPSGMPISKDAVSQEVPNQKEKTVA